MFKHSNDDKIVDDIYQSRNLILCLNFETQTTLSRNLPK